MDRINGAGHVGNRFVAEDVATSRPPTEITPEWMNGVQEELAAIATMNGGVLDPAINTQARDAVTNVLALKAPLASPALSGTPTAPTPAQFDNSTKLATTAFVAENSGRMAGNAVVNEITTLTAASHAGKVVNLSGAGPYAVTLPLASSVSAGTQIHLVCTASGTVTVQRQGIDLIYPALQTGLASFPMLSGDTAVLESDGGLWAIVGGSVILNLASVFGGSRSVSGYQKLPGGLIIQWGSVEFTSSATQTWTLPVAFPNGVLRAWGNLQINTTAAPISAWDATGRTLTSIKFQRDIAAPLLADVFAIGY